LPGEATAVYDVVVGAKRELRRMHRRSLRLHRGLAAAGLPWLSSALAAVTDDDYRRSEHASP
jgi:hypothetical protein